MEDTVLRDWFSAPNVSGRFKALLELSKDRKQIHAAAKSPQFLEALEWLFDAARSSGLSEDILMAASALARVSSIIKSLRKKTEEIAQKKLVERLPPLNIMRNPDDRYYIAKACSMLSADWVADYLAHATIEEDTAEKARTEYIAVLFKLAGSLQSAFEMLAQKFNKWSPSTEKPTETAARRLRRVLSAIRTVLMRYEGEITPDAGLSLARMIRAPFRTGIEIQEQKTRKELISEVAEITHSLIRARFSLATEPATYEAMRVVKGWLPQYRWEEFTGRSPSVRKVASDLLEGITLLVRQGITDDAMFDCLIVVSGSEDTARRKTAELGRSLSSIKDDVRRWLILGHKIESRKPSEPKDLAIRSTEQRENLLLAGLLLDIERLNRRTAVIQEMGLAEIKGLHPQIAMEIENLLGQARAVVDGLRSFCVRRGIKIREKIGEIVIYSPLDHEVVSGSTHGIRKVRVIEPVVEKINEAGVPSVVRKGLVEPC